ncbi:MAG TPA: class I SAM-dependent methyltransferase, partial [Thermoanaerobaculia bacterium]|nr:class I SAM-dependent methyltransferase [Thermoanaerobaculia bacterium]
PEMLDYYVQQGAGIDLVVAPLLRVPARGVRRFLEIGCSVPFALDFGRFAFGWDTLGVDPSPLAVRGAAALGVPVIHDYFDADLDTGPEPFDLVLCSEILEHVADPYPLLSSIRGRLSPGGLLVLSTPNVDIVRKETDEGMMVRALSPGYHLVLYNRTALARVLEAAGFSCVLVEESPETLRAFAACTPEAISSLLPPDPAALHALLRNYLGVRSREVPSSSVFACGLAYRHLKECVNAGLYDEAAQSRDHLARIYAERYEIDLHAPASAASAPRIPFNLSCALFFCGILELNGTQRPAMAAESFAASIDTAGRIRGGTLPFALWDGETEGLLRQSLKHLPMALAATDPERALREIEQLESMDRATFSAALLAETRAQTFIRLVNAGAYAAAERLAPWIATQIETQRAEEEAGASTFLDPLYCLAMLALQQGRAGEAAEQFRRVAQAAERSGGEAQREMLRTARYHESLSRERPR